MGNITLTQIVAALAVLTALITGYNTLKKSIQTMLDNALKGKFEAIEKSQQDILKRLDNVDLENCKNYLVTFLAEIARGEPKDETEMQRFWEEYEHYTEKGGNSYIRNKVEDLKGRKLL